VARWYSNSEIQAINRCRLSLQVDVSALLRRQSRPRNSGKNTFIHFNEHDQVTMSRVFRSALVEKMASIPQIHTYTRFIFQSAMPNPRLIDATKPSDLDYILRPILTTAMPVSASASNCSAWRHCLMALPSSPDNTRATIPRSFKKQHLCRRTS
jgi:hypothetical protein